MNTCYLLSYNLGGYHVLGCFHEYGPCTLRTIKMTPLNVQDLEVKPQRAAACGSPWDLNILWRHSYGIYIGVQTMKKIWGRILKILPKMHLET